MTAVKNPCTKACRAKGSFAPFAMATLGIGALTAMDGLIKLVSAHHATAQVVLLRYAFGSLAATIVFLAAGRPRPGPGALRAHALRAVLITISASAFFYALSTLPLAVALALSFTSPFFIALAAKLHLDEQPGRTVWLAVAVGFAGVLVVLWGELGRSGTATLAGVIAAMVAAVAYAIVMVMLKSRTAHDAVPAIVLLQNLMPMMFAAPLGAYTWTMPSSTVLVCFALIGMLGTVGHFTLAWAYGKADASRLGVIEYTAFVWGVLIGLAAFAEVPSLATILGAALIISGALLVARKTEEPDVEVGP
jgi:drug/metabolite transporter (DMT)-like permease